MTGVRTVSGGRAVMMAGWIAWGAALAAGCQQTGSTENVTSRAGADRGSSAGVVSPPSGVPRNVVAGVAGEPEMRVRLRSGVPTATISSEVKLVRVGGADGSGSRVLTGPVRVALGPEGWTLTDAAGARAELDRGTELVMSAEVPDGSASGPGAKAGVGRPVSAGGASGGGGGGGSAVGAVRVAMTLDGKRFPGTFRLMPRSDRGPGSFDVLELVAMEDYLPGVVTAEMFKGWPADAYRVQAVCARTYALHERARARGRGEKFDVEATVQDQAYDVALPGSPAATAVAETRGVVLTWNGQLVRAYYSSTCGGRPGSARDTWPTGPGFDYNLLGPIQAQAREHACGPATYYRWETTRTRAELLKRLRAWGSENAHPVRGLSGLEKIREDGENAVGRPARFLVIQPGGQSYSLTAEELRRACNQPVAGLPAITPGNRVNSGDMDVTFTGGAVVIAGRGFGHGVGMCQWCAKGFAERGERWDATVLRFYPGAKLERAY